MHLDMNKVTNWSIVVAAAAVIGVCILDLRRLNASDTAIPHHEPFPGPVMAAAAPPADMLTAAAETVDDVEFSIPQSEASLARVVVVEFSDYQCPYCGRYARDTYPRLRTEFIETVRVEYVVKNFPLERIHPFALNAGKAVFCAAAQERTVEMRFLLFDNQESIGPNTTIKLASDLALDMRGFRACMASPQTTRRVRADYNEGVAVGVRGTPTFLFGTRKDHNTVTISKMLSGAQTYEVFEAILKRLENPKVSTN